MVVPPELQIAQAHGGIDTLTHKSEVRLVYKFSPMGNRSYELLEKLGMLCGP